MCQVNSDHAGNEFVDELLAVSPGTTICEWVSLLFESLERRRKLEGPKEVVGLLEVGSTSPDLVDEVLNGVDSVGSENRFNNSVVSEWDSGSVDFAESALVDKLADGITGGISVGDEWLTDSDHVLGGLVELHEHTVVELSESHQLHDLLWLGGKLVNTKHGNY